VLGHRVAQGQGRQPSPWPGQHPGPCAGHDPLALGEDGTGEPLDPRSRHARRGGDLLDGLARAQPGLDVLGGHRALGSLLLTQARQVSPDGGLEPVVHRDPELGLADWSLAGGEHDVTTVLADRDDVQLAHRSSVRAGRGSPGCTGVSWETPFFTSASAVRR
jgi:hypothetical protein